MATTSLDAPIPGYVPSARRVAVTGLNGMVSCAHPQASMAGLRVLLDGGNAVDAIVAMASALNVVEPWMSSALGVGQMLIYQAQTRRVEALDFGGSSTAAANPGVFPGFAAIPSPDIRSPLVPSNLGGWMAALERYGSMDRQRVFRDAIALAEGYPLTEGGSVWFTQSRSLLSKFDTTRAIFVDGIDPRPGIVFRQPRLAESYRQFAAEGAAALYGGSIGDEIVRYCAEQGGLITRDDLLRQAPRWTRPISIRYRDADVMTMPPPSMGLQILQTLNLMEGVDTRALGHNSGDYLHALIEAIKLASVDRAEYVTRPDAPIEGLLSKRYAEQRRAQIDSGRAASSPGERWQPAGDILAGRPGDPGQTTYMCAADGEGNAVSMTQSLGHAFGCSAVAGSTGLLLNDFSWWFDLTPGSPNQIGPNKPVEQCLSPCMVFQDGELRLVIGTPGGHGIMQTTTQMLLNALDFDMNVQQAIEAPRLRIFSGTHVDVESRIDASVRSDLESRGHVLTMLPDFHWGVGGGHGVQRVLESGAYLGGADPRRDGYALGW